MLDADTYSLLFVLYDSRSVRADEVSLGCRAAGNRAHRAVILCSTSGPL